MPSAPSSPKWLRSNRGVSVDGHDAGDGGAVEYPDGPEGPISAAILAASIGSLTLGLITTLAEASEGIKEWLEFNTRVGPLSGKTIVAVVVWLVAWAVLHPVLRDKSHQTRRALTVALVLVALGVIGTLPTFFQLFAAE